MSGLSFGLNMSKKKGGAQGFKKRPIPMSSAFAAAAEEDDSGSEDGAVKMTYRERVNKKLKVKAAHSQARAQEIQSKLDSGVGGEEVDIYDYDGFASEKQRREELDSALKKVAREEDSNKPQYIGNIMATAKIREKERELVHDKKIIKEREREDQLYGDKPKFVTSSYKAKLEEDRQYEVMVAESEVHDDVRKQNMGVFLKNMSDGSGRDAAVTAEPRFLHESEVRATGELSAESPREVRRNLPPEAEVGIETEADEEKRERSEKEQRWNTQVEGARNRYFLRKAVRLAKGCWDL